jgi:hypothetical protein
VNRRPRRPWLALVAVVVFGAMVGGVLAQSAQGVPSLAFLARSIEPGLDPALHLDLTLVTITFGFTFRLNFAILLGIVLTAFIWRRL